MANLYIIATPIGNLEDISKRAIETLGSVDKIYCEDTRKSSFLLKSISVTNKLESLHDFNEEKKVSRILSELDMGLNIAIISDAGTPLISDPGFKVVKVISKTEHQVRSIPGPSAVTSALSISGLSTSSFRFVGFLPKEEKKIISILDQTSSKDTIVAYESPKRINKTLEVLSKIETVKEVSIAREISKMFEEVVVGKPSELLNREYKGEIVLMITHEKKDFDIKSIVSILKKEGLSDKTILNTLLATTKESKNKIYKEIKSHE
ncbi:MAG: 16S rRNA (cytidine(1402)-2'-O)-methyltransferase [Tenericutes bacterium]|nr:MAG: 16S rRNA (cytidine(1402)-2'-O)-methyltransferase [Mycoplasmatota bacterium]